MSPLPQLDTRILSAQNLEQEGLIVWYVILFAQYTAGAYPKGAWRRVLITVVIVLLLCNCNSYYSLGQILYYDQLITHLSHRTIIRAATVLLLVLIINSATAGVCG